MSTANVGNAKDKEGYIDNFITNGKYDVFEINEVLFEYDQPLLGG